MECLLKSGCMECCSRVGAWSACSRVGAWSAAQEWVHGVLLKSGCMECSSLIAVSADFVREMCTVVLTTVWFCDCFCFSK